MDAVSVLCVVVGLRLLSNVAGSLHDMLVALTSSTLVEYWNPLFEGFKMVGHLFCHVAWRIKDVLHRGLLSGSCILRQTCEGICILLSLILYLVNTVVNVVLIGTQNCLSVLPDVLDVVADPVHRVVELALTLLTFLYSCLVGASVLLWTSCQLLLDSLGTFGRVFIAVFAVDCHSLLITAAIVLVALLFRNPRFRVHAGRLSHHLVRRLYAATLDAALALQVVHARTEQDMSRTTFPQTDAETELVPQNEPSVPDTQGVEPVSCSRRTTGGSQPDSAVADSELLGLLKEQEERKKCIICQDSVKTVLLLPCRHLCLCRHCADILTQRRPVQQRCCPLCRQHITQTMDVFL
ncbi:E3 ubiquitin-protein ligase RNF26-like isoform X2 [Anabas testudineus]|uniref:E3 ubiquitin-protein ligase RNF26-like isoform X2 n=1 Tax=Anabas testudineus TaxID=64144 RepID=UPI000E45DF65|nr:E3 ubiquitin-protein ligase RNF26-like isoform X2 [Anabas testudineus]